jgi:hypothetical protein
MRTVSNFIFAQKLDPSAFYWPQYQDCWANVITVFLGRFLVPSEPQVDAGVRMAMGPVCHGNRFMSSRSLVVELDAHLQLRTRRDDEGRSVLARDFPGLLTIAC